MIKQEDASPNTALSVKSRRTAVMLQTCDPVVVAAELPLPVLLGITGRLLLNAFQGLLGVG